MLGRLAKDMAIYGAGDLVFKFAAFAVFPIYAHLFKVEQFGVMELVNTLATLVSLFLGLGITSAVQRFYWDPQFPEAKRSALISTGLHLLMGWSILFTVFIVFILFPFHARIREGYGILWVFLVLALASNIPLQILQFCLDALRLHFSPWRFTLLSGWKNLSGVSLGLLFIWGMKMELLGYFLGIFLAASVSVPFGLWLIRKDLRWVFDRQIAKQIFMFGYPYVFAGLAYWLFGSMDRWMLGTLSDNTQVGLFSIAFKFASLLFFVNSAFGQAWSPFAIKIYADRPDYRRIFTRALSWLLLGLTLIGVTLTLFAQELLFLLTPEPYWAAATIIGFVAMGVVLQGTTQITALGISLERKTYLLSVVAGITALVNVVLNWILIPKWGALGSGIAILISYAVLTGLYLYWTQRLHPIPLEIKKLTVSLGMIVVALGFAWFANQMTWNGTVLFSKFFLLGILLLPALAMEGKTVAALGRVALKNMGHKAGEVF
jgi:O-antigen/teichoic acid export membrane protein